MQQWMKISASPNTEEVKAVRLATLKTARRKPVRDRIAYLQQVVRGKKVLDVGVVDHTMASETSAEWLHRAISQSAGACLGVDTLEEDVKKLQAAGYNVRHADITKDDLGEQFEVIIVGEVIEHLGSPEKLFEAAQRLLLPNGRLVITTPNPHNWKRMLNAIWKWGPLMSENVDHVTMLFPSGMVEFAERAGLVLDSYRSVYVKRKRWPMGFFVAMKRLLGLFVQPEIFCEVIIYECRRPTA